MEDLQPTGDLRTEALSPTENLLSSEHLRPTGDLRPALDLGGDLRRPDASELEPSNTPKIMGAVVVALGVCALGAYTLSTGMWNSSTAPRVVASTEPLPMKPMKPVAPAVAPAPTPAPVVAPASPYQHAVAAPPAKSPTRVAHVRKSGTVTPATSDNSAAAPSVPTDATTPANAPVPETAPAPSTTPSVTPSPATPPQPDGQP